MTSNQFFRDWLEQWRKRLGPPLSPEPYPMTKAQIILCERLKQLGYAKDTAVRLYGETLWLTSDPFCIGNECVFIDAKEKGGGRTLRILIPRQIVQGARQKIA
jgi:hypothetical protein